MLTTHHSPSCARSASRVAQAQHGRQAYYYNCTSTIVHYVEFYIKSNSANIARINITRVRAVSSRASGREAPLPSARASLTPPCPRRGINVKATFDHSLYHSLKISSILTKS